ncbi:MAG: hypothetical protein HWN68_18575 [Desulfobacterales bacterium]|nr:hypothetical protein [Desulfobacterales bacterium]
MADNTEKCPAFDVFVDQFTITITPFGANISFGVREPHPTPSKAPQSEHLGTVRMSVEHLKTMILIMRRQVMKVEEDAGVKAEVSRDILRQLQIAPEDWDAFWKY